MPGPIVLKGLADVKLWRQHAHAFYGIVPVKAGCRCTVALSSVTRDQDAIKPAGVQKAFSCQKSLQRQRNNCVRCACRSFCRCSSRSTWNTIFLIFDRARAIRHRSLPPLLWRQRRLFGVALKVKFTMRCMESSCSTLCLNTVASRT